MNLAPKKIFQLPIIGDALAYAYLVPKYIFVKLLNPILFPLSGLRPIKRGTSVIWVPENKKEIAKEGIGLLQLCDPDMFSRLTERHLLIFYSGTTKKNIGSPSNRVFGLHEKYFNWGAEGVAVFLVQSIVIAEAKFPFNIFKRRREYCRLRTVLDWMCQHSFRPTFINSYQKVVEKWEQPHKKLPA